jgi:hypothetical protein
MTGTDTGAGAAAKIRVKGTSRLNAQVSRSHDRVLLSGNVVDDAGRPLARSRVAVGLARTTAPGSPIGFGPALPEACAHGPADAPAVVDSAERLLLVADEAGHFCVRLALALDRYVAHIEAQGSPLVDGSKLDVAIDPSVTSVALRFERFDARQAVVSLDEETASFEVTASTEDDGARAPAAGLTLQLANEMGDRLGSATTDGDGRARFVVRAGRLGPPGLGQLRASFAGSSLAGAAALAIPIERRTVVDLVAPDARAQRLPDAVPDDGVALGVRAVARCAARATCSALPTGMVEARLAGADPIGGAAQLDRGEGHIDLSFATTGVSDVALVVRYVPDAPWFERAGEITLVLPVHPPSPWRRLPLGLAAAAAVAWVALGRLPRRSVMMRQAPARRRVWPPAHGTEGLALVSATRAGQGWTGRVVDAHDGIPVPDARIAIERPGFDGVGVVVETTSNLSGGFAIGPVDVRPGDQLVVAGLWHAPLRRAVPSSGDVAVALVTRKRALLDRLIAWARRRGSPYDDQPDATPGHVRSVAAASSPIARWADAVERAAYGGGPLDERGQSAIDDLAPSDATPLAIPPTESPERRR